MMEVPAIVIIAFNRPASLKRLLISVSNAEYLQENVPLCICIDFEDSPENEEIVKFASQFSWRYGKKRVIHQRENLGLKAHVLKSGDLSEEYGSIIMLEDDLYVSPAFYDYAVQALNFYNDDDGIGGISLYNHKMNFASRAPFQPIEDGSDVYFLQIASSWGQAWSSKQWFSFRRWLARHPFITTEMQIPQQVKSWPDKSWLKHFIAYLSVTKRYFVYPRISLSTNFGDSGENNVKSSFFFQVPVLLQTKIFILGRLEDALAKYDAFFDLLPEVIISQNSALKAYDFENNLSGLKPVELVGKEWVLVFGSNERAEKNYGLKMKPIEMNVLHEVPGNDISLLLKSKVEETTKNISDRKKMHDYKYGIITPREKVQNVIDTLIIKIRK